MPTKTPRWLYRFDNYDRAFKLLSEANSIAASRPLTLLEEEGTIQRFEYTWELAWKTMKDYLEHQGIILDTITPASTIKAAFAAKLIDNGESWMRALDARNKMSHTYSAKTFHQITNQIRLEYFMLFEALHQSLLEKSKRL
jgi:nucleotidyltransferase substrate binding protein (TIGR01987 family)